jgi:hypothetical protein
MRSGLNYTDHIIGAILSQRHTQSVIRMHLLR